MSRIQRIVDEANGHIRANRWRRVKAAFDLLFLIGACFGLYLLVADHFRRESYAIYVPETDETCVINIDGRTQDMACRQGPPSNEAEDTEL